MHPQPPGFRLRRQTMARSEIEQDIGGLADHELAGFEKRRRKWRRAACALPSSSSSQPCRARCARHRHSRRPPLPARGGHIRRGPECSASNRVRNAWTALHACFTAPNERLRHWCEAIPATRRECGDIHRRRLRVRRETSRRSRRRHVEATAVGADRAMSGPAVSTGAGAVPVLKFLDLRIKQTPPDTGALFRYFELMLLLRDASVRRETVQQAVPAGASEIGLRAAALRPARGMRTVP